MAARLEDGWGWQTAVLFTDWAVCTVPEFGNAYTFGIKELRTRAAWNGGDDRQQCFSLADLEGGGWQTATLYADWAVCTVSESGNIYTFGANGEGQLGVEEVTESNVPKHVETLDPTPYKMLAAGCDHTMALTGQWCFLSFSLYLLTYRHKETHSTAPTLSLPFLSIWYFQWLSVKSLSKENSLVSLLGKTLALVYIYLAAVKAGFVKVCMMIASAELCASMLLLFL